MIQEMEKVSVETEEILSYLKTTLYNISCISNE